MHWPRISPFVEGWCEFQGIETCRDIRDDPEDEPQGSPGCPEHHSHVLTRKTESSHADPVAHPINYKRTSSVRIRIPSWPDVACCRPFHRHQECEADKRVD